MKISNDKFVSLTYDLKIENEVVDKATTEKPLEFVYGMGMLLPEFEKNIDGKKAGDKFEFTLTPAEGYGEINLDAIVELPKQIFMVDGELAEDLLVVGNSLPMGDNEGNRLMGTILEVTDDSAKMDFNHPMAGKTLNFSGEILGLRDATDADFATFGMGNSCDCDSCNDEQKGGCGCGCGN